MIITCAMWLIAFAAAAGYGRLLIPRNNGGEGAEFDLTGIYGGLLIVSTILLAAALFTNLTPLVGLMAALPGIMMYWRDRASHRWPRYYYAIFAVIALFISVREISLYDTALYHQQAVKWLAEHGLVRGVALVHFPLGFVSSWFALAAPLDHGSTAGRVGIVGGLPFAIAIASGLQIIRGLFNRRLESATWAIFGLSLSVVAIAWHVDTSLSPDMIVWLLPLVIVTVVADPYASEADRLGRALLISAMACLIKLTAVPVLLYCSALLALRFFRVAQDRRKLVAFAALALGALALLIGANLTASGCPFFPSPFGCTSLDWSVGADVARFVQADIEQFARLSRHHQILPLTVAAALASALLVATLRSRYVGHILGLAWAGIAFTLIVAPSPRYGLGYFLLPVAALIGAAFKRVIASLRCGDEFNGWAKASAFLIAAAMAAVIFAVAARDRTSLLYPIRIAAANGDAIHIVNRAVDTRGALAVRAEQLGEMTIWVPVSSDQCWDAPLPCTPSLTLGYLKFRYKGNLDAGFLAPLRTLQASP